MADDPWLTVVNAVLQRQQSRWQLELAASRGLPDQRRVDRLVRMADELRAESDRLFRLWAREGIPAAWVSGGVSGVDRAALAAFQRQSYGELLVATRYVNESTKRAVRALAEMNALDVLMGNTGTRAGRNLSRQASLMVDAARGITYRNGAVHSLADWADTAVRTQAKLAQNAGLLGQARDMGVEFLEVLDGPDCGWEFHDDRLALGLIVSIDEAEEHPLAHPRCARSFIPRPDITSREEADGWNERIDQVQLAEHSIAEQERAKLGPVSLSLPGELEWSWTPPEWDSGPLPGVGGLPPAPYGVTPPGTWFGPVYGDLWDGDGTPPGGWSRDVSSGSRRGWEAVTDAVRSGIESGSVRGVAGGTVDEFAIQHVLHVSIWSRMRHGAGPHPVSMTAHGWFSNAFNTTVVEQAMSGGKILPGATFPFTDTGGGEDGEIVLILNVDNAWAAVGRVGGDPVAVLPRGIAWYVVRTMTVNGRRVVVGQTVPDA